ncbi:MAG: hypothetical protein D6689_05625 [Deltaproteobacteria bacterium]|nr:MAG: hypothetical protein D6689_05625 [Deltaproteobacteria bacterium]
MTVRAHGSTGRPRATAGRSRVRSTARWSLSAWLVGCCVACAAPEPPSAPPRPRATGPARTAVPAFSATYLLTWNGRRIGRATETLQATEAGYDLRRTETIAIRRGAESVTLRTALHIALDADLDPVSVQVTRDGEGPTLVGRAHRTPTGWSATFAGTAAGPIPPDAIPLEVLPLRLARQPRYQGPVMLPGYGFATGDVYSRPDGDRAAVVSLVVPTGVLTQRVELDPRGGLARVTAPGGVESRRVAPADAELPFDPPDVVAAAAIPVAGRPPVDDDIIRLRIAGVTAPPPRPLPGQLVLARDDGWDVTLAAGFAQADVEAALATHATGRAPDGAGAIAAAIVEEAGAATPMDEVRALARYTDRFIADDLGSPTVDARAAFALGRGDCTAHAAVFAALGQARHIDVRLVTGYRLTDTDEGWRLVRHRWAIARVDGRWLPVDPTYGEAPARAVLLGLAVHGAAPADIAVVDEVAFAGLRGARAHFASR